MTTSIATYSFKTPTSRELQKSTNNLVRMLERLTDQSLDFGYVSPKAAYFKTDLTSETELVIQCLKQSLHTTCLIQNLKMASFLKKRLQKLISACALLEMKNISLKETSYQLKNELIRLNHLQKSWYNATLLKN